jgi:type IV pilus assembly protein PilO
MDFNLEDLKKLSPKLKALILCLVCLLVGYLYYMLLLEGQLAKRAALGTKLTDLTQQAGEKERLVAQIGKHRREVEILQESFKQALLKLPNEREIAGLLASVVMSGKEAGVEFLLFEPKPPEKKPPAPPAPKGKPAPPAEPEKFYDEILIKVELSGTFHNTLTFFERVARLPRIVNVEGIVMGDAQDVKGRGRVVKTSCIVKTYMFVDRKS